MRSTNFLVSLSAALVIVLAAAPAPLRAQDNQDWLKDVFGDSRASSRSAPSRAPTTEPSIDRATRGEPLLTSRTLAGLDNAIRRYEEIARRGGWPEIPGRSTLRPGSEGSRVEALRRRLIATGDLAVAPVRTALYDAELQRAVAAYQQRMGLTPTGIANTRTLTMLNVPARQRHRQLVLNRDRIAALLPQLSRSRYVLVNIPAFELQAIDTGRVALFSRVIVGKPTTPTPEISAAIKAINLLPYWHVPQSIATRALVPKIQEDIHYLDREHIRVFSSWGGEELDPRSINWWAPQEGQRFVFRQDPGPFNALGLVRLDMPNREIVYMHDTPLKRLFNYALRPYSAGCVRVQNVLDLAGWLAEGGAGLTKADLMRMINAGQRETIDLREPVPVHFAYVSAWVTGDGTTHFRPDIYDKDQEDSGVAKSAPWGQADVRVTP